MKILYVLHQFFPNHYTGTERLTLQIARQIQRMGNFVSVLTYEPDRDKDRGFNYLDEYIMKKEYQVESVPVIAFKSVKPRLGFYIFDPLIEKYLQEIVKDFDIVHFTHPMRFGSVLKVCKELRIPTILTLTDHWLLCPQALVTNDLQLCAGPDEGRKCMSVCKYEEQVLARYKDAKFFFDNIDLVFSGSRFVIDTFMKNNWFKKIKLNTFSVDYSFVKQEDESIDSVVFGFIGSLIWHKGPHVLIDAFKKVKNRNTRLKIFGSGVEGDGYVSHLFELAKNDSRIEFCGTFEYKELPKVMRNLSVIVIPSTYKEIYPLVMQMGLAYKKPVIASRIGGMPEVVKNKINGYLFELGNVEQLADILSMISENPELIEHLKRNITYPPRIEEEAFSYENAYRELSSHRIT